MFVAHPAHLLYDMVLQPLSHGTVQLGTAHQDKRTRNLNNECCAHNTHKHAQSGLGFAAHDSDGTVCDVKTSCSWAESSHRLCHCVVEAVSDTSVTTLEDGLSLPVTVPRERPSDLKGDLVYREFKFLVPGGSDTPREITLSATSVRTILLAADTQRFPHNPEVPLEGPVSAVVEHLRALKAADAVNLDSEYQDDRGRKVDNPAPLHSTPHFLPTTGHTTPLPLSTQNKTSPHPPLYNRNNTRCHCNACHVTNGTGV